MNPVVVVLTPSIWHVKTFLPHRRQERDIRAWRFHSSRAIRQFNPPAVGYTKRTYLLQITPLLGCRWKVGGEVTSGVEWMSATLSCKVLSVKSGTVLIAALANPASGRRRARAARPCFGLHGHAAATRMGRILCAATGRVRRNYEGTARHCSLRGWSWFTSTNGVLKSVAYV